MADEKPSLVVIGSGWVGLYIAQYVNTALYSVSIISPRRTSAYTPLLASAACGLFPFSCAEESLRTKGRKCRFIKAVATSIDFTEHRVHCEAAFDSDDTCHMPNRSFDVVYDKLIICPGCETNTFGTPGVAENSLFMKHVSDAMALRKQLFDQLEKASLPSATPDDAAALLHVAIVGGGPTGVEITAELSDLARCELKDLYPDVAPFFRITIYDVAPHILSPYDKCLYEYATKQMAQRGVKIETGCMIKKVSRSHLYVDGRDPIPYGMLLWVAGNKSVALVDNLDAHKSQHGLSRILTDSRLRVKKAGGDQGIYESVYALGDAADIDGNSLPTTAEVAVQKAKYLVQHLNSSSKEAVPFVHQNRKLVTYLGNRDGITEGSHVDNAWTGRKAWLSWRSGSFTWTRTWRNWAALIWAFVINFLFGKDVMRM